LVVRFFKAWLANMSAAMASSQKYRNAADLSTVSARTASDRSATFASGCGTAQHFAD
jgi:hypothetical protein